MVNRTMVHTLPKYGKKVAKFVLPFPVVTVQCCSIAAHTQPHNVHYIQLDVYSSIQAVKQLKLRLALVVDLDVL